MKNILIYGNNSFLAKNFTNKVNKYYKLHFFKIYFINENNFKIKIINFIKKNKINCIINFAANNDNAINSINSIDILKSNFTLPSLLVDISSKLNIELFLFLSKEMKKKTSDKDNFYSFSKNLLLDYIQYSKHKNKIRLINLGSIYGPMDLNLKRLIPSMIIKLFKGHKIKINLNQNKEFTFVDDVIFEINSLLSKDKKFINASVRSKVYNMRDVYNHLKNYHLKKGYKRINKYDNFIKTFNWYLENYEK